MDVTVAPGGGAGVARGFSKSGLPTATGHDAVSTAVRPPAPAQKTAASVAPIPIGGGTGGDGVNAPPAASQQVWGNELGTQRSSGNGAGGNNHLVPEAPANRQGEDGL
jgi:hypothetical protein